MKKLLSANFARMFQSKTFWALEIVVLLWGIFQYSLMIINTKNIGELWLVQNVNFYFFLQLMYIGVVLAIFTSFFIGTEYSDGTIRNKLTVGHSRQTIYLANMIVTIAVGMIFAVSHVLTAFIAVPYCGIEVIIGISSPGWRSLCWILIVGVYAAVFTLFAMLDSSKTRNVLISLLLALVIAFFGVYVYGKLAEPEFISQMVMNEQGTFELIENIPNAGYLRGTMRTVFEWMYRLLPSSQALYVAYNESIFDLQMPICMLGISVFVTVIGVQIFRRKDIR